MGTLKYLVESKCDTIVVYTEEINAVGNKKLLSNHKYSLPFWKSYNHIIKLFYGFLHN